MPYERDVNIRVLPSEEVLGRTPAAKQVRGTKDGAMYVADWIQSLISGGHGFSAGIGLLSAAEALPFTFKHTLHPSRSFLSSTGIPN